MQRSTPSTGFSLLELSIVLIILGLLAGGIMVGQDMIRQAHLKSILNDAKKYETAYNSFVTKYDSMPGDMPDATDYWGAAPGCPDASGGTGTQTCNGNGSNWISNIPGEPAGSWREQWLGWQHLASARMVEGRFTGIEAGSPRRAMPGENVPQAAIPGTGFSYMAAVSDGTGSWWTGIIYALVAFGLPTSGVETVGVVLTPTEMQGMDDKIDDGLPAQGLFRSFRPHTNCHTTDDSVTARYNLTNNDPVCAFTYSIEQQGGLNP